MFAVSEASPPALKLLIGAVVVPQHVCDSVRLLSGYLRSQTSENVLSWMCGVYERTLVSALGLYTATSDSSDS